MSISSFVAALRQRVCDAWPEVERNGVWLVIQIERFAFQDFAEQGRLPVAIVQLDLTPTGEFGVANRTDAGRVSLYYIDEDSGPESVETLLAKAEALRLLLWQQTLAAGQIIGWPSASCDENLPPNEYFLNRNLPFLACGVTAEVVITEGTP